MTLRESLMRTVFDPDSPRSVTAQLRAKRWLELNRRLPQLSDMKVLDLGGTSESWSLSPARPAELVLLNLRPSRPDDSVREIVGDACDLPPSLVGEQFDLVYSNSVIEHVGGHLARSKFAENVHRLAPNHWIQTPYRYFPIEPHWIFPVFQYLPTRAQLAIAKRWRLGHKEPRDRLSETLEQVMNVELLDRTSFAHYFPHSNIFFEKVAGLPKSLVALLTAG
jgi:hypothetical protein